MAERPTPGFRAVSWVSPTQQVRQQLLDAIRRGEIAPGGALPSERELCKVFGVSRVSVREAIAGLEAMGLITVQHGRGAFVRGGVGEQYAGSFGRYLELHRDGLLELMRVRGALDELAAQEAAARGTPDGLAAVAAAHEEFRAAAAEPRTDVPHIAELDVAFHLSIAHAAPGGLLPLLLADLNGLLAESRLMTLSRPGQLSRSVEQHQHIVDAIAAGDVAAASGHAAEHIATIRTWIEQFRMLKAPRRAGP